MDTDTVIQNFPVSDGGPYDVILSKKSWGNEENVGGWVQGYLCDCTWGSYHSGDGSGGGKWSGRFCSHAYATLLAANMRARQEFMNDRRAGRMAKILGECAECGEIRDISPRSGLCRDCQDRLTFNAFVTAGWNSDKTASEDAIEFMDENASEEDVDRISDEIERVQIDGHTALLRWNGYRAIVNTEDPDTRQASRKDATRHFTYAEMLELDEEIDDKPLHNKNRLRDYPKEL
jgi:hypothetical protein